MKKINIALMLLTAVLLTGCQAYHQGKSGIIAQHNTIEMRPLEVNVKVGEKITGAAECKTLFGFISIASPKRLTYGPALQTEDGNFASKSCTRGAIYDAMSKNNADIVLMPQYTVVKTDWVIYKKEKIIVTGYKGTYGNIKEMSADTIKARQMSGIKNVQPEIKKGFF